MFVLALVIIYFYNSSENNRQKDDDDEITILTEPNSSTQGIKSRRKCTKTPSKNRQKRSQKTETPDAAAENEEDPVEIIAEPDQPIEIFEDLPTQERKSRKPRPGKESLLNHLRSIIGADDDVTENEVFKVRIYFFYLFITIGL